MKRFILVLVVSILKAAPAFAYDALNINDKYLVQKYKLESISNDYYEKNSSNGFKVCNFINKGSFLALRENPNTKSKIIKKLPEGHILWVDEKNKSYNESWLYVSDYLIEGHEDSPLLLSQGWVSKKHLCIQPNYYSQDSTLVKDLLFDESILKKIGHSEVDGLVCNLKDQKNSFLALREEPNKKSKIIKKLFLEEELSIDIQKSKFYKNWFYVNVIKDDSQGWVSNHYVCQYLAG